MSEIEPSTNGVNGSNGDGQRGPDGKFLPGNRGGPGSPHVARIAELRASLLAAVSPADISAIVGKLVDLAKAGDVDAARLVLDRVFGKPTQPVVAAGEVKFHPITLDGDVDLSEFDDEELLKFERAFTGRSPARPALPTPALPAELRIP